MLILSFPFLVIPIVIYNLIAFLAPGVAWTDPVVGLRLFSGVDWKLTFGDLLLMLALLMLFVEILKATRGSTKSVVDHMLSTLVFVWAAVEFLVLPQAANSTFAMLAMICLIEMMSAMWVMIRTIRRQPRVRYRVET
jgi:hypothetical protein